MKLAAVIACRNRSTRLYAKPLQNLDVKNSITILDFMIGQLKLQHRVVSDIILAIADEKENDIYKDVARQHRIPSMAGDVHDVLHRMIKGAESVGADHVLRVTSESPYVYYDTLKAVYEYHCENKMEYSIISGLPEGSYFELISLAALKRCWNEGGKKYHIEYCSLYIFDHQKKFHITKHSCAKELQRPDIRLTVDWPEDLIVVREIYKGLKLSARQPIELAAIITFLDKHPKINAVNNWIDAGRGRIWY